MEPIVRDAPVSDRYEIRDGDRVLGFAAYHRHGDTVVFTHTEVDPDGARIELIADPLGEMYGQHVL